MASEVRLISLRLDNFMGARRFSLELDGDGVTIYGDNATGKTTLKSAWNWLLFGKDADNKAVFDIKTLNERGEALHNLEHQVEGVLEADGRRITLTKVYKEKWEKKRGSTSEQFTGHTTNHFVNEVPATEKEYQARVAQIADESTFRLHTDPHFFNEQVKWPDQRNVLLRVCGDVSAEEVFASNRDLASLTEILDGRSVAEHKLMIIAKRKKINDELKLVPVRIAEATKALPTVSGVQTEIRAEIAKLNQQRQERAAELTGGDTGAALVEAQKRRNAVDSQLLELERSARAATDKAVQAEQTKLNQVSDKAQEAQRTVRQLQSAIQDGESEVQRLSGKLDNLKAAWRQANSREFAFEQSDTCPTCGQALPAERLQEARETALAAFNHDKASKLEANTAEGKRTNGLLKAAQASVTENQAKLEQAKLAQSNAESETTEIRARITKLRSEAPDPTKQPEYQMLQAQKTQAEQEVADIQAGNTVARGMVNDAVRGFDQQIEAKSTELAKFAQLEQGLKRIKELEQQEKDLATEFERLEYELNLCDQFIEAQATMLEERVNSYFTYARFRLFTEQINGGKESCCDCLLNGVPYASMNSGGRIKVGLDIINTLSNHYGFTAPIWVDNAESVTSLIPTRAQMIRLVVSEPDKTLRVVNDMALERAAV